MTEAQALEAITQRFVDQWPTLSAPVAAAIDITPALTTIAYARANKAKLSEDYFAQLQFLPGLRQRISQGGAVTYQQHKWIVVQIWVPANTGALVPAQLRDVARAVFERQSLAVGSEAVTIDAGMDRNVGAKVDGRWDVCALQLDAYWFESR